MHNSEWRETLEYARQKHGQSYLYRQLAEECIELALAALKYVRATKRETSVTLEDAREHLIEELADACNMIDGLYMALTPAERDDMATIRRAKQMRMKRRLTEGGEDNGTTQEGLES